MTIDEATFRWREPLPRCRHCRALARPNILMFGDWSWLDQRKEAQRQRLTCWVDDLMKHSAKHSVLQLVAGSGIPTVRHTSEQVQRSLGGTLIRINPREADVPRGQLGLPFGAAEGIQRFWDCL